MQGLVSLERVRPGWAQRLSAAQSRWGDTDARTLQLRCRVMAFDELAGDIDAASTQIDAVLPHVSSLGEEERWLFVLGLHWLAWQCRRRPPANRCRLAFEGLVASEPLPLSERISLGLRLARAASAAGRVTESRWILERASQAIGDQAPAVGASPYRGAPTEQAASANDAELAFEVRCERVRLETNACDIAGATAAMAELDRWVDTVPHVAPVVVARQHYWHGLVNHVAGHYAAATTEFAAAAEAFEGIDAADESAAAHRTMNLLAWVDALLDQQLPEQAVALGRRAAEQATSAAQRGHVAAVLAAALVQLGQDAEAEAMLDGLPAETELGSITLLTRALLALRGGQLGRASDLARLAVTDTDRNSPLASDALLTLGRVLTAAGRPRLGERVVRRAAALVLLGLGPRHPQLGRLYRFMAERRRAAGALASARSLDAAADAVLSPADRL